MWAVAGVVAVAVAVAGQSAVGPPPLKLRRMKSSWQEAVIYRVAIKVL